MPNHWGTNRQWHRKPKGWDKTRKRIALRDGYTCQRCQLVTENGHCSHIIPQAKGGSDEDDNLRWLCDGCNMREAQHESMRTRGAEPRLSRVERRRQQGDYFGGNFACAQDKPIAEALSRVKECGGQSWP